MVEMDSYAFHSTRAAFERDRRKDAALVAQGYRVIRVTWRQIVHEPEVRARAARGRLAILERAGDLGRDLRDLGRRAADAHARASSASCLAAAVPAVPETIAPAWPIVLPGGAVKPAM